LSTVLFLCNRLDFATVLDFDEVFCGVVAAELILSV